MDYTIKIDLPDHKAGDRWPGIASIGPVLINGSQPADTLARVRMHLRGPGGVVYRIDSDATADADAPVVLDNATTWQASIPAIDGFLPTAGRYAWDMEFFSPGTSGPLTLYKGTLTVHPDVTKD